MLESKVLIRKFIAVDGLASATVSRGEVTSLNPAEKRQRVHSLSLSVYVYYSHEVGDDPMEATVLVAEALFTGRQSTEVVYSLGYYITE